MSLSYGQWVDCSIESPAAGRTTSCVISFRQVSERRGKARTLPIAHVFELAIIARAGAKAQEKRMKG